MSEGASNRVFQKHCRLSATTQYICVYIYISDYRSYMTFWGCIWISFQYSIIINIWKIKRN